MKYRIVNNSLVCRVQYKYKYWPFWITFKIFWGQRSIWQSVDFKSIASARNHMEFLKNKIKPTKWKEIK